MLSSILYIDPGTGSYILQILLAGLLGVMYFFKNLRMVLFGFFSRLFNRRNTKNTENDSV